MKIFFWLLVILSLMAAVAYAVPLLPNVLTRGLPGPTRTTASRAGLVR